MFKKLVMTIIVAFTFGQSECNVELVPAINIPGLIIGTTVRIALNVYCIHKTVPVIKL